MWVKICGVRRAEDARAAVRAGADAIGLNFFAGSARCVSEREAGDAADAARAEAASRGVHVDVVGVFVNERPARIAALDAALAFERIQLHGEEPPDECAQYGTRALKALRIASRADLVPLRAYVAAGVGRVLLDARAPGDARGGTGHTFDWALVDEARADCGARGLAVPELVLAGGLGPENVAAAVRAARPFG